MKYDFEHKLASLIHREDVEDLPFRSALRFEYEKIPARLSRFQVAPDIHVEVYVLKKEERAFYFRELLIDPTTKEVLAHGEPITPLGLRSTITSWINTYFKKTSRSKSWVEDRRRELTNLKVSV